MSVSQMSVSQMSVSLMPVGQMPVGQFSATEMFHSKMSVVKVHVCQNASWPKCLLAKYVFNHMPVGQMT